MKVSPAELYTDPFVNGTDKKNLIQERNSISGGLVTQKRQQQSSLAGHDKIISQNERDFFIQLFPNNSEQLGKHTLFNQNGRIQTPGINKGMIVDGRA